MGITRRKYLLGGLVFFGFVFLQWLSGKNTRLYSASPTIKKLELSNEQWRKKLSANAYAVLRERKTEVRRSSPLNYEWRAGVYTCQGCDLVLFESTMKYESNTGWPSFFDHCKGHLETYTDLKAVPPQRGYKCARCGGHQGHLFMDGPLPTGERWCNNGVALRFIPSKTT